MTESLPMTILSLLYILVFGPIHALPQTRFQGMNTLHEGYIYASLSILAPKTLSKPCLNHLKARPMAILNNVTFNIIHTSLLI